MCTTVNEISAHKKLQDVNSETMVLECAGCYFVGLDKP